MKTAFTSNEHNNALEFAYSMGLKRPYREEQEEDALNFAYAMGLKKDTLKSSDHSSNAKPKKGIFVPRPRFI